MRVLFVHQSFPGQYRHIVRALAHQGGHQIVAMGIEQLTEPIPESVQYVRYGLSRGTGADVHLVTEIEVRPYVVMFVRKSFNTRTGLLS